MATLSFPQPTQLKNLSAPSDNQDAATKAYVDSVAAGGSGGTANPSGSNTQVQFNDDGVFGATSGLTFNKSANKLTVSGEVSGSALISTNSGGDEGGEIRLALAQTNTTLDTGITIDVYQNKLRIFETGGTNRGGYIDLSAAGTGVGSNLLAGSGSGVTSYNDLTDKPTLGTAAATNSTDYATAAQGLLAASALQSGDNISGLVNDSGYATETFVTNQGYLTSASLTSYATTTYVDSAIASVPTTDLTGYATELYVTSRGYITNSALNGYATEAYVDNALSMLPTTDLTGYATETFVTSQGYITSSALTSYATQSYVTSQGYITSSALTDYATQSYVGTQISNLVDAAPTTLNTLNELAAALGDDPNFATTIATSIGQKANTADLATVAFSGSYNDLTNKPTIGSVSSISNGTSNVNIATVDGNVTISANGVPNVVVVASDRIKFNVPIETGSGDGGNIIGANVISANYFMGNGAYLTGLPASYSDTQANAAIDARVTKSFVDALNVNADTLDGLNSTAFATAAQGTLADSAVQPGDLATVATTGAYSDLTGKPTLFSGSYTDLTNKPTIPANYFKGLQLGEDVYEASGAQNIIFSSNDQSVAITRNFNNIDFSVTIPSLTGYATETFVTSQGYITSSALAGYATQSYVTSQGYITSSALTGYASQTYVDTQISNLVDTAPDTLNTLNELAAALGDDPNFATTITTSLSNKLNTSAFSPTANTWLSAKTTSNLTEGTNLYYTELRANNAIDARVTKSFVDNLGVVASSATTAESVTNAAQLNITSVGVLTGLTVTGLVTTTGTGIKTANILDSTGTIAITTKYNNEPGSVGVAANLTAVGNITGSYFIGNGSQLTGMYSNTNAAAYLPTYTGNITANNVTIGNLAVSGNITDSTGDLTISTTSGGNLNLSATNLGRITLDGLKWPTGDGTSGQVLSTDGAGNLSWSTGGSSGTMNYYSRNYYWAGSVTVNTGTVRLYVPLNSTLTSAYFNLATAGTTNTVVTTKKNGTSVGTTTLGSGVSSTTTTFNTAITAGTDYITVDITTAGAGAVDLYVTYVFTTT